MKILITGGDGNIAKMIKNNLSSNYEIVNLSRNELNILNYEDIKNYLDKNKFDILVHTAILGGRRLKEENGDVTHYNLLMFENLLKFSDQFKMIINFDSAAIYNRSTDILNRKEDQLNTIPNDYYGFSKYVIYQRSLQYNHFYNFRIFNIFHSNEEPDRFIKSCFLANKNGKEITIFEDKYIWNTSFSSWDKIKDINESLESFKFYLKQREPIAIISFEEIYGYYEKQGYTPNKLIASKRFFEKYICFKLSEHIVYDKFIQIEWINT